MEKSHKQTYKVKVVVTNPKTKEEAKEAIRKLSEKLTYILSTTNNGVMK